MEFLDNHPLKKEMLKAKGCCALVTNEKVNTPCKDLLKEDDPIVGQLLCELSTRKSQCLFLVREKWKS